MVPNILLNYLFVTASALVYTLSAGLLISQYCYSNQYYQWYFSVDEFHKVCGKLAVPTFTEADVAFVMEYVSIMKPVAQALNILQTEEKCTRLICCRPPPSWNRNSRTSRLQWVCAALWQMLHWTRASLCWKRHRALAEMMCFPQLLLVITFTVKPSKNCFPAKLFKISRRPWSVRPAHYAETEDIIRMDIHFHSEIVIIQVIIVSVNHHCAARIMSHCQNCLLLFKYHLKWLTVE